MLGRRSVIYKGESMATKPGVTLATTAILTMAGIQAAAQAFEQGEINVFDALDAVAVALEAYEATAQPVRKAA
jgi:ferritin-like metal-binding protein YciE